MSLHGVAGLVQIAVYLEQRVGLEALHIGRGGLDPKDSCTLELCGRHLFYVVLLDGGFVFLAAQSMDAAEDSLERLLSVGDTPEGLQTIGRFLCALERSGLSSLSPKPIQIGEAPGPNCWVIV
jgi:hypothetical protein